MNIKYFFVKNLSEFLMFPKKLLEYEAVKKSPEFQYGLNCYINKTNPAEIYNLYRNLVKISHKSLGVDIEAIYNSEIFGETEIDGLKIDFNFGLRLDIPKGNFHVKISDFETETIFFDEDISDCRLMSSEIYYIKWHIEIFLNGEKIFDHIFDPSGQTILIAFVCKTLGDALAFMPYVAAFQKIYNCKLFIWLPEYLRKIISILYPKITQVKKITLDSYATFYMITGMGELLNMPIDSRTVSMTRLGGYILGLENLIPPLPKFTPTKKRKIKSPYVCISVQASGTLKSWLYPGGWEIVCDYLKNLGYRVLCIDKNEIQTGHGYTVEKPKNAENFCGDIPLIERANMLYYADFFIGLGSGLSWLANAVGCEVILISNFSETWYEFETPYRVKNNFVCGGCFNDVRDMPFKNLVCFHKRNFECQKKISPHQVISAIDNLIADKNLQPPKFR